MPRFTPWYRSEEYALIREIMDDRDTLPLNFDEWEKNAESERAAAKREGITLVPIFLDADEFFTFCKEKKISPNSVTAAEFANSRGAASYSFGPVNNERCRRLRPAPLFIALASALDPAAWRPKDHRGDWWTRP